MTQAKFIEHLRQGVRLYDGLASYARQLNVSPSYLGDVMNGKRPPGRKILDGAGFERITEYRRKAKVQA